MTWDSPGYGGTAQAGMFTRGEPAGLRGLFMRLAKPAVFVLLVLSVVIGQTQATWAQGVFPLEPNVAVATMRPQPSPADARFVLGTYDIRDPICDAPPFPSCNDCCQGCVPNWFAPMYHNAMPNPTGNPGDEWTQANIGLVFGIALDNDPNPSIYLTSTSVYFVAGTGTVTKIDGTTGAISVFATLPNTGSGLGNIAFDHRNRQFYVSNHEDGKIYRLNFAGAIIDTFDPFGPDDGTAGFAPLSERIWGLQVSPVDGRLYFGTWLEDSGRLDATNNNRVYAVDLDGDGGFLGSEVLQLTLPDLATPKLTNPISDISFSAVGEMLIAERTMVADSSTSAHSSRIMQFVGGYLAWVPGATFEVGILGSPGSRTNSAGGVDHTDCVEADACNPGPLVMTTCDAIDIAGTPQNNVYGIQIMPATGGTILNSWGVDLDADLDSQDKTVLGDVEVVRTCVSPPPPPPPPVIPTVTEWGLLILVLLLLAGIIIKFWGATLRRGKAAVS